MTYTIFGEGVADRPFEAETFSMFPDDWLEAAPGVRITSALIRVEENQDTAQIERCLDDWFVHESLAVSEVVDKSAVIA